MATGTKFIGTPVSRVDGREKVTGQARYTAEVSLPHMAYAVVIGSSIVSGRVRHIEKEDAESVPGVRLILTHDNRGPIGPMLTSSDDAGMAADPRPPLEDDRIFYTGQAIAMVVADTLEAARYAASLLWMDYDPAPFAVAMQDAHGDLYFPGPQFNEDMQVLRGDCEGQLAASEVRLDARYSTPNEHPCAMEPHATVASWSGDTLTIYNSTQWVKGDQAVLATAFGLPLEKVHVRAPFVGGMFGSKVYTAPHTILAAIASIRLQRPVKVVLARSQVLSTVAHRTETVQRIELGASLHGNLMAMRHSTRTHTAVIGALGADEFIELASGVSRSLYAVPAYEAIHECVRLNVTKPGWMRAPGECPGTWALESAMDELSYALAIDPVELRRRNHTDRDPHTNLPFSSKHLLQCYELGAARFGWERRSPEPGSMREGNTRIGWGMATATHPGWLMGATVRVRLWREGSGIRASASTAGIDVGTGMYTMMALTAAEGLGLPLHNVSAELGDSRLPFCSLAGGSNLTASTAPAILDACAAVRGELLTLASAFADGFDRADERPNDFVFDDGRIAHRLEPSKSIGYEELLSRSGRHVLEAQAKTKPVLLRNDRYVFHSFGAQFVEVRVNPDIGRVRVSRVVGVFDVGRVMNAKAVRSQLIGGIVFGIGQALLEELVYDRVHGQAVNNDLAGYLVPVNADVPEIDVSWIDAPDIEFNSVGCRGAGEIGITGMAAAIANAIYHATGKRVRNLPITPDKLL